MKKIALCSLLMVFSTINCFAGGWHDIKVRDGQKSGNNAYWNIADDHYLECDDDEGDVGDHVFGIGIGLDRNTIYAQECCLESGGDRWRERKLPWCNEKDVSCVGTAVHDNKLEFCFKSEFKKPLPGTQFYLVNGGIKTKGNEDLIRKYIGCKRCLDGFVQKGDTCFGCPAGQEIAEKNIEGIPVCNGKNCRVIKAGECYDRKYLRCMTAIAERKETKIVWNDVNGCVCTDDGYEFNYDNMKCEKKSGGKTGGKVPGKTSTNCTYAFRVKCTNGTEVTGLTGYPIVVDYNQTSLKSVQAKYGLSDDEIKQCVNNKALDNSNTLYVKMWNVDNNDFANKLKTDAALNKQILNFCASHGGYTGEDNGGNADPVIYNHDGAVVGPDDTKIKNAQDVLSAFTARAKREASGWKTEDGKFNTMRLASDLSAGVVLGTVGGVVSGVVIKKKQVEKGFDALHCTVGGQTIADWGDTFSVGLQR